MKRFLLCIVLALAVGVAGGTVYGQVVPTASSGEDFKKVGAAGGQFLKMEVGARAAAMAGAYSGVSDDLTSLFWNPAGIARLDGIAANFSYTQWFADFSHNFVAASMPVGEQFRAALHVVTFTSGDIEVTTVRDPEGTGTFYSRNDLAIGATFGGYLTDQFSFGVTTKFVKEGFSSVSSSGLVFDVGTMYETGINGINLGFSISNLGSDFSYEGQDLVEQVEQEPSLRRRETDVTVLTNPYPLPLSFRAGIAADVLESFFDYEVVEDETREHALLLALDFVTLSDTPEQYNVGAEYTWNELLALRAGYKFNHDELGFSGGLGINYVGGGFAGTLDYALSTVSTFDLIHRISIGVDLN